MARARNIKPAIMDNEDLAELEPLDRLLFIYLWMLADREGRLEDRPKRIAKQALAYDRTADAAAILDRLAAAGFIRRYVVDGNPLLVIANFVKHQSPHGTEKDSLLPGEDGMLTVHERSNNGYATGRTKLVPSSLTVKDSGPTGIDDSTTTVKEGDSDGGQNSLIPDSLIPDSLIPETLPLPPKGGGRGTRIDPDEEPDGFGIWYALYRRKDAKRDAIKAWRQLEPDEVLQARMVSATEGWKWSEDRTKIPMPASWIRGRRWEDEAVTVRANVAAVPGWCMAAGFPNVFEAANAQCWAHTAHLFRDGQRLAEEASA